MTATPLHKTYGAALVSSASTLQNNAVFTFEPVPPGFIWTGTISIVFSQQLTVGANSKVPPGSFSNNDVLANWQWTFYRNGNAEFTWIGLSMPANIQLFGNDVAMVTGYLPQSGINPITIDPVFGLANFATALTLGFNGYAGTEAEVQLVVPFLSTSVQSAPNESVNWPGNFVNPAASVIASTVGNFSILTYSVPVRIWSAWLSLTICGAASQALWAGEITDALGNVYLGTTIGTSATSVGHTTSNTDLRGIFLPASTSPLKYAITLAAGTGTAAVIGGVAGLTYTVETPLIPV